MPDVGSLPGEGASLFCSVSPGSARNYVLLKLLACTTRRLVCSSALLTSRSRWILPVRTGAPRRCRGANACAVEKWSTTTLHTKRLCGPLREGQLPRMHKRLWKSGRGERVEGWEPGAAGTCPAWERPPEASVTGLTCRCRGLWSQTLSRVALLSRLPTVTRRARPGASLGAPVVPNRCAANVPPGMKAK